MKSVTTLGMLALLSVASSAAALVIDGGPSYSPPGGGSCAVSGSPCQAGGATVNCTGLNPSAVQNLYFGIRNSSNVNGDTETGVSGPAAGSTAVFRSPTTTVNTITYTGATQVTNLHQSVIRSVVTKLVLIQTGGVGTIVSTGGNPAANNNGDIGNVWQLTGTTFKVNVNVEASDADFPTSDNSCPNVFDPSHANLGSTVTNQDISHVDLAFYWQSFPTVTPTVTPTQTFTRTQTPTLTPTETETPVPTDTPTETATQTDTPTLTPTSTRTRTPTLTPTLTFTTTPTESPTQTFTRTVTFTPTITPSVTITPTPTGLCIGPVPSNPCIPGGGPKKTDCNMEWVVTPVPTLTKKQIPKNKLICYEGDPRCDVDTDLGNGSCTINTGLCINNADPRLAPLCTASALTFMEVKKPKFNSIDPADQANLSTLENQAGPGGFGITVLRSGSTYYAGTTNGSPNQCSGALPIQVPLHHSLSGKLSTGRKSLRVRAYTLTGLKDTDSLRLQCRVSTCGDGVVQADHEECDDGNRLNGDGCDQGCHFEHATPTPTNTPADTSTATATITPTNTVTDTPTLTPTNTPTDTPTETPTNTFLPGVPTFTPTSSPTRTATRTPTNTRTPTSTPTITPTPSVTPSPTATASPTPFTIRCNLPTSGTRAQAKIQTFLSFPSVLTINLSGYQDWTFGGTDGNGVRQINIPASGTHFDRVCLSSIAAFCVRPGGNGTGSIDCDGGNSNYDNTANQDHNSNSGGGFGPDPSCTATFTEPNGQMSSATLEDGTAAHPHTGVCNSPLEITESGTFAAGGMKLQENLIVRLIPTMSSSCAGANCPADNAPFDALSGDQALVGVVTSGTAASTIYNANNGSTDMSPTSNNCGGGSTACAASTTGIPFGCDNIDASNLSVGRLGLALPALDLTLGSFGASDTITTLTLLCQ